MDCFGAWKMTDEEEKSIQSEIAEGWRKTQERMANEVSRH